MRFIAFLLFLIFIAFAFGARWYFVCEIMQECETTVIVERPTTLELIEKDSAVLIGFQQFAFEENQVRPTLNENNKEFLDQVATYFKNNSVKDLTITSFFRNSEAQINSGYYENIGIARAAYIRDLLVERGVEEERISINYGSSEDPELREPILFESYQPDEIPQEFEKIQFTFNNMTFSDANFAIGSDEFKPGKAFEFYADSVKQYLATMPSGELVIIGHTDNTGTEKENQKLGLRRAESARKYFKDLGVAAKIKVESEGESKPVAPNNTKENKQKNRRVNFLIIE